MFIAFKGLEGWHIGTEIDWDLDLLQFRDRFSLFSNFLRELVGRLRAFPIVGPFVGMAMEAIHLTNHLGTILEGILASQEFQFFGIVTHLYVIFS